MHTRPWDLERTSFLAFLFSDVSVWAKIKLVALQNDVLSRKLRVVRSCRRFRT